MATFSVCRFDFKCLFMRILGSSWDLTPIMGSNINEPPEGTPSWPCRCCSARETA